MTAVLAPRINTNDDKIVVVDWHVEDGDPIEAGAALVDLETSKAVVTVECETSGFVRIIAGKREIVRVGSPLCEIAGSLAELCPTTRAGAAPGLACDTAPAALAALPPIDIPQNRSFPSSRFSSKALSLMQEQGLTPEQFTGAGLVTLRSLGHPRPSPAPQEPQIGDPPASPQEAAERRTSAPAADETDRSSGDTSQSSTTLRGRVFSALQRRSGGAFWFRLRHAFPHPALIWQALRRPRGIAGTAALAERIVILGIGTAALSCAREFKRQGFRNLTFLSRDDGFGGKCVHVGCMPSAFALSLADKPVQDRRALLGDFITGLRDDVRRQFQDLDGPLVLAQADQIIGKTVLLADGRTLAFDRLIVATGSRYPVPAGIPLNTAKLASIETFWHLQPGTKLVIYAADNVAALSLGEVALALGLRPTVLLAGHNPLARLPSYRYCVSRAEKRGLAVVDAAKLIAVDDDAVTYERKGRVERVAYDQLLLASRPIPNFLPIDGVQPTLFELDLRSGCLPQRPDIAFVGDASGYFTAAEADNQARLLAGRWAGRGDVDLDGLATLPLRLDSPEPLTMTGPPWTLGRKNWLEIDFRTLGWSKIHGLEGKLWYLLDEARGRVEALHICHRDANELVALGSMLMRFPVWDRAWCMTMPHPSAAEIFKVLAERALQQRDFRDEMTAGG